METRESHVSFKIILKIFRNESVTYKNINILLFTFIHDDQCKSINLYMQEKYYNKERKKKKYCMLHNLLVQILIIKE